MAEAASWTYFERALRAVPLALLALLLEAGPLLADRPVVVRERHLQCVVANAEAYLARGRIPMLIVLPACERGEFGGGAMALGEVNLDTARLDADVTDFLTVSREQLACLRDSWESVAFPVEGNTTEPLLALDFSLCVSSGPPSGQRQ